MGPRPGLFTPTHDSLNTGTNHSLSYYTFTYSRRSHINSAWCRIPHRRGLSFEEKKATTTQTTNLTFTTTAALLGFFRFSSCAASKTTTKLLLSPPPRADCFPPPFFLISCVLPVFDLLPSRLIPLFRTCSSFVRG